MSQEDILKRLEFIRTVVRKNPVSADGMLMDLEKAIRASIKAVPPPLR